MSVEPAEIRVLDRVARVFERIEVRYVIGGSMASSYFGDARSTYDIDVLTELQAQACDALLAETASDFHVEPDWIRECLSRGDGFQIVHKSPLVKVDIFTARDRVLDREQLERRVLQPIADSNPRLVYVSSPETIVLRKLDWFRIGGLVSERQWNDVLGVLKVQARALDLDYMRRTAKSVGLDYLLRRALTDAGLGDAA